jgi:integrase/recombinase XerC
MTDTTIRIMCDLIAPHLRHLKAAGFSANTIEDRGLVLRRVDRDLPMGLLDATVPELDDWLAQFRTNQTKATYYGHLVGFFGWACGGDDPWLDWNPTANLKRPKVSPTVPRPVEDDAFATVLQRADEPYRTWAILAACAGLRAFEIAGIERAAFTPANIIVKGKGGKNAAIPTHPLVWEAVKDLPPGPIARGRTGVQLSPTRVSSLFGKHMRKLGLIGVSLHPFRHWLGTRTLQQHGNIRVAQELLRHSSPATTAIYTQITDEQRRTAVAALPVPGNPAAT